MIPLEHWEENIGKTKKDIEMTKICIVNFVFMSRFQQLSRGMIFRKIKTFNFEKYLQPLPNKQQIH